MLFKKKGKQPQEDPSESTPPETMDSDQTGEKVKEEGTAANESKVKAKDSDIVYPSGLKLAFLMSSIFIGMFLVSLVRYVSASGPR